MKTIEAIFCKTLDTYFQIVGVFSTALVQILSNMVILSYLEHYTADVIDALCDSLPGAGDGDSALRGVG